MSLASQAYAQRHFPRPVNRGGRPPASASPVQRRRHIKAAHYFLIEGRTRLWVARRFGVDEKTVYNWVRRALSYPEQKLTESVANDVSS